MKNIEDKIPNITNVATYDSLNAKKNEVKCEIPSISNLATTAALNAKANVVKGAIANITNLATTTAAVRATTVKNKIPNVIDPVTKIDFNTKISEIEFNKLPAENFSARLKPANLASKSDIANFVKKTDFDNKLKDVTTYKNKLNELSKKVEAVSTKWLAKDLIDKFSILNRAKHLSSGMLQNNLVFIPAKKHIKYFTGTTWIELQKSNGMSEESIEKITKSNSNFAATFALQLQ